ncbi:helix-turn-helix domain-containing protein [Dysgonomonas sp. 520]|uniref:helix-turn-helix domain-containing protein n=1 Tax=Dysgonomonas sp. 520 TaxID=2302931 RepID=UPI0013D02D0D|nr:helix-turn-helix domain-containing protein [Dysgonomonas sp. 520]NDW08174.1 AraC family transcriptional regulator [Dysgonomonas sp. 520]
MKFEDKDIKSSIRFVDLDRGQKWKANRRNCSVILVDKGRLNISFSTHREETVSAGKIFLIPTGYETEIKAVEASALISVEMGEEINELANFYSYRPVENDNNQNLYLSFNQVITAYIKSLLTYKDNDLNHSFLAGIKVKELMCILKASYAEEELAGLFSAYISYDLYFSERVRKLSQEIKNIRQLAEMMNYSYSGFNKRFRKVFGMSAYSWFRQERVNVVFHDIYHTNKSLKQISIDNRFNTLSHFNEFCHRNLGNSPSEIRRKNQTREYG